MPATLTSVHPPETPVDRFDDDYYHHPHGMDCPCKICGLPEGICSDRPAHLPFTLGTAWRHSGWRADRQRVADGLSRVCGPSHRVARFAFCGDAPIVLRSVTDPNDFRIVSDTCKDRFCLPCSRQRATAISTALQNIMTQEPHRFITLTLRSDNEPLADLVKLLYASFRRLRTAKIWTEGVIGGAAFLETKYSPEKKRWHPHLHILTHGKYMPHAALKNAWEKASRGSTVVDIRLVRSQSHVLRYVTKYVTKGFDSSFIRIPVKVDEAIRTLKGVRMVLTFGDWRTLRTTQQSEPGLWERVDTLESVLRRNERDPMNHLSFLLSANPDFLAYAREWMSTHDPPTSREALTGGSPVTKQLRLW